MTDRNDSGPSETGESSLDRAAHAGPLPGVASEDAAQQRGEDHSSTGDDGPGNGDIVGGTLRDVVREVEGS